MDEDFLKIECPGCKSILIVRRRDGKLLEVRKPILEESTGDRWEDAFKKVKQSQSEVEKKVEEARQRERQKQERLEQLFKDGLKRAQEEGPAGPPKRDIDLD